jgi:hypothetical protein
MSYPHFYTPESKLIRLFSPDFEKLLDQGYRIENLLKIDPNQLPIFKPYQYIPFTGQPDIDLTTLSHLSLKDLFNLCLVNQYTNSLCQRKDFWLNKINQEQLILPQLNIININWLHVYNSLVKTNSLIQKCKITYQFIKLHKTTLIKVLNLLNENNINYIVVEEVDQNIKNSICIHLLLQFDITKNICHLMFKSQQFDSYKITINNCDISLFLLNMFYYNLSLQPLS